MNTQYDNGNTKWTHNEPIYDGGMIARRLLGPCPRCGSVTSSYGGSYSCHNDYCQYSSANFVCNVGSLPVWWNKGINVQKDGDAWCATNKEFINLQESSAGFGNTPNDAALALIAELNKE